MFKTMSFLLLRRPLIRAGSLAIVAMFLVASCGGEPEARTRNRTLNSVTCYQTQAEKDSALADAESALAAAQLPVITPDTTPTLSDASPADAGQLAFIGPVQWWKRVPRATDTTIPASTTVAPTTTAASTTTAAPTTTVRITTTVAPTTTVAVTTTVAETTTTLAASTTAAPTTTVAEPTTTTEPAVRTLNPPSNVQAVADGTSVTVSWTAPEASNTPVEDYNLIWSTDGFRSIAGWRVNGLSATVPNFAPGATVQVQVRADNDTYRVYSGWSNVASATIASAAVEETTTTAVADQSSGEETTTSLETADAVALVADLQSQVDLIRETPLCADLEAAAEIECAVQAGFDADRPELASITTCPDADEVRVQYDGGFGAGTAAGGEVFLMNVGAVDQYVFQVARAGVVIASGTVQRGDTQSFTGIDQASLVTTTTIAEEDGEDAAATELIECEASAGLDLNVGIAYVDPCDAATAVQITFEGAASGDIQTVSNGSRASVPNPDRVGFTFEVYVGNDVAVSGSVAYPTEPAVVVTLQDCPVSVIDEDGWLKVSACNSVTRIEQFVERTTGSAFRYSVDGYFHWFQKWSESEGAARYDFGFYIGDRLIETLSVSGGGESAGANGRFQQETFADVESKFTGSFERVVEESGEVVSGGEGGTGDLGPRDGYVICTATASVNGARFSCARPLQVQFMATVRENSYYFEGDETSVFGPVENAENGYVFVYSKATNEVVLDVRAWGGELGTDELEYQFYVPDVEIPEEEFFDEEDGPYFSGWFTPDFPTDSVLSFTIPDDYSADYFELTLTGETDEVGGCSKGEFGAALRAPSGEIVAQFVMAPWAGCAVGLYAEGVDPEEFRGATFDVIVYEINPDETPWEGSIEWWGTVDLRYGGGSGFVEVDDDEEEESISDVEWREPIVQAVDAPQSFSIEIGAGGEFFEFRGNSLQFGDDYNCPNYVDPFLKLYDASGHVISTDDDSGENDEGTGYLSSRMRGFLPEGIYTLLATTYDLENSDTCEAEREYQLALRFGSRVVVDVIEEENPIGVTTTTTATTTVPSTSTTTTTTVPSTEESTEESTTTTTTTAPSTSTTVPAAPVDTEPVVTPLSESPTNLQPDPPTFVLPVKELQVLVPDEVPSDDATVPADDATTPVDNATAPADDATTASEEPSQPTEVSIGIPSTLRELVCDETCVELLLDEAGVDEAAIEITLGSQSTVIDGVKRSGVVAIRPGARQLTVTITPTDGSAPVVLTRDVVVLSPRVAPTKVAETASLVVSKKVPQSNRLPLVLALVGALVVLAGAGSVLARRGKGRAAA